MPIFLTHLNAIDLRTGEMNKFSGDEIDAPSWELAEQYCLIYKPYLKVIGRLSLSINLESKEIEYDETNNMN